jgi:hypothetical protein
MQPNVLLKTLKIIHLALCFGLALFAVLAYLQIGGFATANADSSLMLYLVPTLSVAGYFGSKYIFASQLRKIVQEAPLSQKLQQYFSASILQYAVIEGPGFLALLAYFTSGNALFLVIAICLVVYLFSLRPSYQKLKNELKLSYTEQKDLDTLNT